MTTPQQSNNQQVVEQMTPDRSQSDDAKASVAHMQQLQVQAQARINANQHANQIGSQP